jgi:hypothetical protein
LENKPNCPNCRSPCLVDIAHIPDNISLRNFISSNFKENLEEKIRELDVNRIGRIPPDQATEETRLGGETRDQ